MLNLQKKRNEKHIRNSWFFKTRRRENMRPTLFLGDLTKLTDKKQKKVCTCKKQCETFMILVGHEDFFLCETQAKEHLREMQRLLGGISTRKEWTDEEEQRIIEYMADHGKRSGAVSRLAIRMGITPEQLRHKISNLRKEGKLQ